MFNTNPSTAVWSTATSRGDMIEIASLRSKVINTGSASHPRMRAAGTMIIRVIVWKVTGDVEDLLYRALDQLLDNVNDFSEDAKQLFDAQNIQVVGRFDDEAAFRQVSPCEFVACLKWVGDPTPDGEGFPEGSRAWEIDRAIPARTARY